MCMCVSVHEKDFHWLGKKQMLQPNELYAAHMNRSWAMAYARELHTEKAIRTNNGESKLWNAHTSATDRQIERLRTKNQQAMEKKTEWSTLYTLWYHRWRCMWWFALSLTVYEQSTLRRLLSVCYAFRNMIFDSTNTIRFVFVLIFCFLFNGVNESRMHFQLKFASRHHQNKWTATFTFLRFSKYPKL